MNTKRLPLREVDETKITLIVDNSVDLLLATTEVAHRFPLGPKPFERNLPTAEHGFSAMIEVRDGNFKGCVLFDTGVSKRGLLYNLDALEIQPQNFQAVVLSHGHPDHAMGLPGLAERLGNRNLPLILHPDAYLQRKVVLPNGAEIGLPPPSARDLRNEGVEVLEENGPSMMVENRILVSGEIARTTEFEKGFPIHYCQRNQSWEPDPLIMDDQCAIVHVRNQGLVIITGCGHSGIINIIRNAQELTGVQQIHAVVGGFHLTGGLFEKIIPATIAELQKISPRFLMPGHCTGWSATHQIARAMPEAFIPSSVGTTLNLIAGL